MLQTANGTLSSQRQGHVSVTAFLSFLPEAQLRTKRQGQGPEAFARGACGEEARDGRAARPTCRDARQRRRNTAKPFDMSVTRKFSRST